MIFVTLNYGQLKYQMIKGVCPKSIDSGLSTPPNGDPPKL
jgi:hypothetical protein